MTQDRYLMEQNTGKIIFFRQMQQRGRMVRLGTSRDYGNKRMQKQRCTVIEYLSAEMKQQRLQEYKVEKEFEEAIRNEEFQIYYQPKVYADTEQVIGAEALVRWKKQDGSMVPPSEFIPLYEKNGLIEKLDEYVFCQVCRYQRKRMEQGKTVFPISVNLSRISFQSQNVADRYIQIVHENRIPCSCIPIEVTESAAVYSQQIKVTVDKLIKNGFSLQMDDFGAGYSSLMSLTNIPFTTLKLDKELIDHMDQDRGKVVVEQAILMAHMLHMEVIAEGVENKEQVETLKKMDCHKIQGYYYGCPMPEDEFERYSLAK